MWASSTRTIWQTPHRPHIEKLVDATALNVSKAATSNNLGLSYFDNEEFDLAQNCFDIAAKTEQMLVDDRKGSTEDLAFYYNNIGLCCYHQADPKELDLDIMADAIS